MPFTHSGAFDASAVGDVIATQAVYAGVALPAGGVFPANSLTGAVDMVVCLNSTATPGTVTTRTATQMVSDLQAQLGLSSPPVGLVYFLRITHSAAATLTLSAGTGVTFGTGTYTVATATFRDFVVTINSPSTITIQTTGVGTWS